MKIICGYLSLILGVTNVLVAETSTFDAASKKVLDHKVKIKSATATITDVQKAVGALKDQFAGLKKQKNDLKKQQEALDKQIASANSSLGTVGQLVDQTKKDITETHTAAIETLTEAQNSAGSSTEQVQVKSLSAEVDGMIKLNKDTVDAAQKALSDVRKDAIDVMG